MQFHQPIRRRVFHRHQPLVEGLVLEVRSIAPLHKRRHLARHSPLDEAVVAPVALAAVAREVRGPPRGRRVAAGRVRVAARRARVRPVGI